MVADDGEHSTLYVSAPGYKSEDISIEMYEGRVDISGSPSVDRRTTLVPKKISLKFTLSSNVLVERAEFKDGLLAIHLIQKYNKVEIVKIPIQDR